MFRRSFIRRFSTIHSFAAKDSKGNTFSYHVSDQKLGEKDAKELSRIFSSMGWTCSTKQVDEESSDYSSRVTYTFNTYQRLTSSEEHQLGKLLSKCGNNVNIMNKSKDDLTGDSHTVHIKYKNGSKISVIEEDEDGHYETWTNKDYLNKVQQVFAATVAIGTVLYLNDRENPKEKTSLGSLLVPACCGFFAPLTTVVICASYVGYTEWRSKE